MNLLPVVWALIIAFIIVMYVILDGFTLGTGILMPFMRDSERDIAASVILPTWDGNQTWLVLGGASLYGAFPVAFSMLLPLLYLPLMCMLMALLLRGVVFEFRLKAKGGKRNWDWVFSLASLVVTGIQGLVLGNFVSGFVFTEGTYLISDKSFFEPFSIFTAISLVFGYALLGATRLILKTEGTLQAKMYKAAWIAMALVALSMFIVSIWTPFVHAEVFQRWFGDGRWIYLSILPLITLGVFGLLIYTLYHKIEGVPFYASIGLFLCPYIGFMISVYPYIVPYKITVWQAASPNDSLIFILVGTCIMLPVLLVYTGYSYKIFKGKVKEVLQY